MRLLILQTPFGDFCKHAIVQFTKQGHKIFKISFNGGDLLNCGFYGDLFTKPPHKFRSYIKNYIKRNSIEAVVAFGDCRFYHRVAGKVCKSLGLPFIALEEGYLRPNYITVDAEGVNANSRTNFFEEVENPISLTDFNDNHKTKNLLLTKTPHVILYYLAKFFMRPIFPYYHHHRSYSIFKETYYWIRSARRRLMSIHFEHQNIRKIIGNREFYFVPLQVHNDSQIEFHSHYSSIEQFIDEVMLSFSRNAGKDKAIVFKHHPQDIGFKKYSRFINDLSKLYGITTRVIVLSDFNIPNLLRNSIGCITINSTVGLSAIIHNTPTIALGKCFYNKDGITHQHGLDTFWNECSTPDENLKKLMFHNIRTKTQVNGSFYDYSEENISLCVQTILARIQKHWLKQGALKATG